MGAATLVRADDVRTSKGKRGGFPPEYRRKTPVEKETWLASEECKEAVENGRLQCSKVAAEVRRLAADSAYVSRIVPTPARLDEHQRGYAFPPAASPRSRMRTAERVLHPSEEPVLWPADYLSGDAGEQATFDVVIFETERRRQEMDLKPSDGESSATARALRELEERNVVLIAQLKLETEDETVLKSQIDRYLAGKPTSLFPPPEK